MEPVTPESEFIIYALIILSAAYFAAWSYWLNRRKLLRNSERNEMKETIDELMVAGEYTALGVVNIRSQMKTSPSSNIVGAFTNGLPFRVYQVYDELDGIVWGRISSNTGSGKARYAALRVNNNDKVKLEKAFPDEEEPSLVDAINSLTAAVLRLATK